MFFSLTEQVSAFFQALMSQFDPEAWRFLTPHVGKVVSFQVTGFPERYFRITKQGLQAIPEGSPVDLTVSGPLSAWLETMGAQGPHSPLHVRGDMSCLKALYDTWAHFHWDWEAFLSKGIGGDAAHLLSRVVKGTQRQARAFYEARQQDLGAYLQEAEYLPSSFEVSDFIEGVDAFRLSVDRLEAQVAHWQASHKAK